MKSRLTAAELHAATRRWADNEKQYGQSSHGRRSQALMAYATAGNVRPAEDIMIQEPMEVDMNNADIMDMLKGIQAQLGRIEERMNGSAVQSSFNAVSGQFTAVSLSATIDKGKTYWKVQGGPFMQHGILIWPEVLAQTDFADASPMQVYDLVGYTAVYTENDEGHKKIISLSKSTPQATAAPVNGKSPATVRDENGNPEYQSYADAAQPAVNGQSKKPTIGKSAEAKAAEQWRRECETAVHPEDFDLCLVRLEPWYRNVENATAFRLSVFGKDMDWNPAHAPAVTAAMLKYAAERQRISGRGSHNAARPAALKVFDDALVSVR